MPSFTIDLTENAVTRLQALCTAYNQNEGTKLTLQEWLLLHVQEMAVAQELGAVMDGLRRQSDLQAAQAFDAAIRAERQKLIDAL